MKSGIWMRTAVVALLTAPLSGCFSALCKANLNWNHSSPPPSTTTKIVAGSLDAVTAPIQIPFWGLAGVDVLEMYWDIPEDILRDFNVYTDRFERRRYFGRRRLQERPAVIFEDPAFLSAEKTGERAALKDLLFWEPEMKWGFSDFQIECLAELVGEKDGVADELGGLWKSNVLTPAHRRRFLESVRSGRIHCSEETLSRVLNHACVTEAWLEGLLRGREERSAENCKTMDAVEESVSGRLARLKAETARKAEAEARRKREERERHLREEEEIRRIREAEARRKEEIARHLEECTEKARLGLTASGEDARDRLSVLLRREKWFIAEVLRKKDGIMPEANLTLILDEVLAAWAQRPENAAWAAVSDMPALILARPEVTEESLRKYYAAFLEFARRPEGYRALVAILKNPNLPEDVSRSAYRDPRFAELLRDYAYARYGSDPSSRTQEIRLRKDVDSFETGWARVRYFDRRDPEYLKRLMAIVGSHLPDEAPADWTRNLQ